MGVLADERGHVSGQQWSEDGEGSGERERPEEQRAHGFQVFEVSGHGETPERLSRNLTLDALPRL